MVGFGPTLIFYLRWIMRWFTDHARREFNNDRLIADVRRGGWVVDLMHAWHEDGNKGEFPQTLIDKLSRNLFTVDGAAEAPVDHPAADVVKATPKVAEIVAETSKKITDTVTEAVVKLKG